MTIAPAASRAYRLALDTTEIRREEPIVAGWLTDALADTMMWRGKIGEAIHLESDAVQMYERARNARDAAGAMVTLGVDYYMKGDFKSSLSYLMEARPKIPPGNKNLVEYLEAAMGLVLERLTGRKREALTHLNRAVKIFEETGDRLVLLEVLSERIILRVKLGNIREAKSELEVALKLKESTERRYSLGILELATGALLLTEGKLSESEVCFRRAGRLLSVDAVSRGRVLWWRSLVKALRKDEKSSKELLLRARKAFEKTEATGFVQQVESVMTSIEKSPPREARDAIALAW